MTFLVACGGGTSQPDAGTDPGTQRDAGVDAGVEPTCTDGIKNGAEVDVDCGDVCGPCTNGKSCAAAGDCASGICANGACVECESAAQCPGQDSECAVRTCEANTCAVQNVAEGTPVTEQTAGDCKKSVCNGQGQIVSVNDDADVHDDANGCTTDTCTEGVPSNAPVTAGTACSEGSALMCDGAGACVGCLTVNDCPGADSECATRTCTQGMCGVNFAVSGTVVAQQTAGDCQTAACDGQGGVTNVPADLDIADDANSCTTDACLNGTATHMPTPAGSTCTENSGSVCDGAGVCVGCVVAADCPGRDTECATRTCVNNTCGTSVAAVGTHCSVGGDLCDGTGACQWSVTVVRVGDGAAALASSATPVFLERRVLGGSGAVVSTTALPVAANGDNAPFTLSGTATSEGQLNRSLDGRFLVMAGYATIPGTASITSSLGTAINRVAARIDSAGSVDTTTKSSTANSGSNPRVAASTDGSSIWISGSGSPAASGGVWYLPFGTTSATQVLATPSNVRSLSIYGGQLYGSSGSGAYVNVFTIGSGLPTTGGQTAASFSGMPTTAGPSPYGFVVFDLNPAVTGVDTLYVADDRALTGGGGIQKWVLDATGTWTLNKTLKNGLATGARGLAGWVSGANVILAATTVDNKLVSVVDDGSADPAFTVAATAPTNTAFRGVSLPAITLPVGP